MALVGMMMVMLLLLTGALIGVITANGTSTGNLNSRASNAMLQTRSRINTQGAINMADSGVRAVMQWLNFQASSPSNMTVFRPSEVSTFFNSVASGNYDQLTIYREASGGGTEVEGTVNVRVFPFADNDTATTRSYVIEAVGMYNGKQQIVRAVAAQDTFAKYAFFSENAPVNTYFSFGTSIFNGPVHINGRNMDTTSPTYNSNAKIQILWKDNGTATSNRLFRFDGDNAFTTSVAQNRVNWYRNSRTNESSPTSSNDWNNVAARGSAGVRYSAPLVEMPTQSSKQRDAALGSPPATIPGGKGVVVPSVAGAANGGIYINGDVDTMVMSTSGTNNATQVITLYQTEGANQIRTTITIDPYQNGGLGRVRVQRATAPANNIPISTGSFTNVGGAVDTVGTGNGVIYVAGNIGSQSDPPVGGLSGTIANNVVSGGVATRQNNLNIVTDSDKNVNINGDLRYQNGSGNPNVNTAVLGIVTKKVQITEFNNLYKVVDGPYSPRIANVTMDATVFAFDTFDAVNALSRNYLAVKSFTLTGGYIVNTSGTFASVNDSGTPQTGFTITRNYDSRLANRPPPFFPSTSNQYKLRSYQVVGQTL
jgi:hypothetical protein